MKTCICIILILSNKNYLLKFAAMSAKYLNTKEYLPNILFKIDIMKLSFLPCFCVLFKRQLEIVAKVSISKVAMAKLACIINI